MREAWRGCDAARHVGSNDKAEVLLALDIIAADVDGNVVSINRDCAHSSGSIVLHEGGLDEVADLAIGSGFQSGDEMELMLVSKSNQLRTEVASIAQHSGTWW